MFIRCPSPVVAVTTLVCLHAWPSRRARRRSICRCSAKSELSLGCELNPRTTLVGTGPSTGTNLTRKVQMFMAGWQRRF